MTGRDGGPWHELSPLLPSPADTLLLKACLHHGPPGRDAWAAWAHLASTDNSPDALVRTIASRNMFAPLLAWNLGRNAVPLPAPVQTYLRSSTLTDEIRWRKYHAICGSALAVLGNAELPFVVLKGAAFGERFYPSPALRHTGDVDLLLQEADLPRAARVLCDAGWQQTPTVSFMARHLRHTPPLVHRSGLPLELHRRLTPTFYTLPYDRLWARSLPAVVAGAPARTLGISDSLLHICLHAMGGAPSIRWVADAWFLLEREPHLDWDEMVATTRASRAALPVYAALRFLADRMGAPVPAGPLEQIGAEAEASGFLARRAARPIPTGSPGEIWSSDAPWWRRAARLARRAVPSPLALALQFDIPLWQIPFDYVHRTIRYLRWRIRPTRARPPSAAIGSASGRADAGV